jgi:hypothetical protein
MVFKWIKLKFRKKVIPSDEQPDPYLLKYESKLDEQTGMPVDVKTMTPAQKVSDSGNILDTVALLNTMATTNAAVSRLYFPPPTLISHGNKKGANIGGSTCLLSIGTGNNLWVLSELERVVMWLDFYKKINGSPVYNNFTLLPGKNIDTPEQMEDALLKSLTQVIRNKQIFLGVCQIEGNAFNKAIFDDCPLDWENIKKLNKMYTKAQKKSQLPKLFEDDHVKVQFFGPYKHYLTNSNQQGSLEIAKNLNDLFELKEVVLSGIVCINQNQVNMYILANNIDILKKLKNSVTIDYTTLNMIYSDVDQEELTPVSWFKINIGLDAFQTLPFWYDIESHKEMEEIKEKYQFYFQKLLSTKNIEDSIAATKKSSVSQLPK